MNSQTSPLRPKALNDAATIKQTILRYCIYEGKHMIPSLAEALGYSVPTITKYIGELMTEGYFIEYGKVASQRGRKPIVYGVNPSSCYFVGVDIGRFALNIGIMNLIGEIIYEKTIDTYRFENSPASLDQVCEHVRNVISGVDIDTSKIANINVNISGRVNAETGYSYSIFNFEENDEPLAQILSDKIGYPVQIENDTRAMTYGELASGNARRYKNALFVNASWGLGLGIIIGGELYYGKHGYSGEFGHINVYQNEIMCHCGKKGCLETEVSGSAIYRKLCERIRDGQSSVLSELVNHGQAITVSDIVNAANLQEDTLCIELIEQTGSELGRLMANMINIFNPEAVIIGGTLAMAGESFLSPIKSSIRKYSLKLMSRDIDIMLSAMPLSSGMIGACMAARQRLFPYQHRGN